MKSKIIISCLQFFVHVIFSATSNAQNYQNKTGEKFLCSNKCVLTTYFKEFEVINIYAQIYMLYSLSLANCKQLIKCNHLYQSSLFVMFLFSRYLIQSVLNRFDHIITKPLLQDITAAYRI